MLVLQKIYIDFRLSTRLLPLALVDLCVARSLGIAQGVFLVLQRMPKSVLWRGQIDESTYESSRLVREITFLRSVTKFKPFTQELRGQ